MSRPFEFRVWNLIHKYWMNSSAVIDCNGKVGSHFIEVITEEGNQLEIAQEGENRKFIEHVAGLSPDTIVIQQFTGLYDENRIKIFEGDILESTIDNDKLGAVELGEICNDDGCYFGHYTQKSDNGQAPLSIRESGSWYKIIGNIYENPELLS